KEPGAAEAALDALVKAGRGNWQDVPTTAKGGRPSRSFVLSTLSTVYETPTADTDKEGSVDVDTVDPANSKLADGPTGFPFGFTNPADPDGDRLFPEDRGLPD